ncbi:MAG: DUF418 domain-containing protein [Erythrobacter sp.]|jgi:uncharacterized protein|uniref:DUF418 domain-containing protein n=1 Tax=Erythrobacter sp. TaxID=1042 RepID=UPI002B48E95B|nr:DUF418 domain-containing protein [Erythrobacter sp.]WRH69312.1 MAG: DUF418 domain-containing protein [Erythrobacter sp.]
MAPAATLPERPLAPDALRGAAVLGMALMVVHGFALPGPAAINPTAYGATSPADIRVWLASFVFLEDKLRAIFAMLLGAGCMILLERGDANPWRAHYARMTVLFAIGFAHWVLLADHDVLRGLALAGLALPLLAGLSARALIAVSFGLVIAQFAMGMSALGAAFIVFHVKHSGTEALLLAERQFGHDPATIALLLEQGRAGLAERIIRQLGAVPSQFGALIAALPLDLAGFALGMGLHRAGMFKGEWRTFHLQRLAGLAALLALPALFALAGWLVSTGFPAALVGPVALVFSAPFDLLLAVSYAALAMAFVSRGTRVTRTLAAVGRLSLTNTVMTNMILGCIFAPWGLGLFGEVTRAGAFALAFVPIIAVLVFSPLWVAKLGQGPLERLWRKAAKALS